MPRKMPYKSTISTSNKMPQLKGEREFAAWAAYLGEKEDKEFVAWKKQQVKGTEGKSIKTPDQSPKPLLNGTFAEDDAKR